MDEKEKRCYWASFNGILGAERNPTNYQRRDDANHIYQSNEYYEWWYNDASFEDGWHMVVVFHSMNAMTDPPKPSMMLTIYNPEGIVTMQDVQFETDKTYTGADWCDVRIGDNWLKDRGDGTYELYVKMNGFGGHLVMKNVVPGWKLGTGFNYKNEETGMVAGWLVPVPHAEITGTLFLDKATREVKGAAYHDHNWGNYRPYKTFSGWYWGRIHGGDYTIDYAWVFPREKGGPIFSPLLIAHKGEIVLSSNSMEAFFDDMMKEENQLGPEFAKKIILKADQLGVQMNLTIVTKRLLENWQLPKITDWDQFYFRFLADYTLDVVIDGKKDQVKGELLHEFMVL